MSDREKVIKGLEFTKAMITFNPSTGEDIEPGNLNEANKTTYDACVGAIALLKEQEKEIKALRLLVEWAEECDFGFDQFYDEYEQYKDEIKDMKYIDGMVHVAKRTLEDHGAFEEGR